MLKIRRIFSITIILIVLLSTLVLGIENLPNKTTEFYVADYARVISSENKSKIISINKAYESTKEKPQIVVATIDSLDGSDIVSYSVALFEKWKIGNGQYDNGVLILLSVSDRRIRIEVGYGLEGILNDSKVGSILDSSMPLLSADDYSNALVDITYKVAREINSEYGYDDSTIMGGTNQPIPNGNPSRKTTTLSRIIIAIALIILFFLDVRFFGGAIFRTIMWILLLGRGGGRPGGGGFGGGGSSGGGGADRGF